METFKLSPVVKKQLPDFVRSDYPLFVTFLEKYYEWLEQNNKVHYEIDALRDANDIDQADSFYIEKLKEDLAPYFPKNILADKRLFLKLISEFYKSSGTQQSVKFLFKALYNDNIEIYYPKEDILVASDGKWVLPLALRVDTNDNNIFNITKTLITGQTSKATAIVEKITKSVDRQLGISYVEIYLSNIERFFETGEILSATYIDQNTQLPVTVTGRLIGSLSEIKINPNNRGLFYNGYAPEIDYDGDPVSIIGGLNANSPNPIGAIAYVGRTTTGGITDVIVNDGGFGFREELIYQNSSLVDFKGGFENAIFGAEANAYISLVDSSTRRLMNVSDMAVSVLDGLGSNTTLSGTANVSATENVVYGTGTSFLTDLSSGDAVYFGGILTEVVAVDSNIRLNVANNFASTSNGVSLVKAGKTISRIRNYPISNVTTFASFNVHPIAEITMTGSGGGYKNKPAVKTYSFYNEDVGDVLVISSCVLVKDTNILSDPTQDLRNSFEVGDYARLYIKNKMEEVREVKFVTEHELYFDEVFANDLTGVSVFKMNRNDLYKLGAIGRIDIVEPGSGYSNGDILVFTHGSGYGANGYVNVNVTGSITSVTMNSHSSGSYILGGEGYRRDQLPTITIQSAAGSNGVLKVSEINGDGEIFSLVTSRIGAISTIRVVSYGYDYVSAPKISLRNADLFVTGITEGQVFVSNTDVYQGTSNSIFTFKATVDSFEPSTNRLRIFDYRGTLDTTQLIKSDNVSTLNAVSASVTLSTFYGDGNAKATSKFENGLIRYPGIYLNTDGQVSAEKKLQDGEKYHNFSYILKTKTDYNKFKKPYNDILHPVGTKVFVTRVDENQEYMVQTSNTDYISVADLPDTYNVSISSNTIISTNASANLVSLINVGDYIMVDALRKQISGNVKVFSGSNVLTGNSSSVNFINDLQDGDEIELSSGDVAMIKNVVNVNSAILLSTINISSTSATINVVYDETGIVTSLNASTIKIDTNFKSNGTNRTAIVRKVR